MELSGGGADHTIEFIGRLFSRLYHNTFYRYVVEHLSGLFKEYLMLCWVWLDFVSNMYLLLCWVWLLLTLESKRTFKEARNTGWEIFGE